MAEQRLERRDALHHRAHRQQRVEPVAELAREALSDEVGGDPLRPVVAVLAIAHGRVGNDAGVEPRVAHVRDAADTLAALRAGDLDGVDPRAVRGVALELVPTLDGALLQLLLAADDVEPAALAAPDGQRQAPVALLGDHPVAHVGQPVQLAVQPPLGNPAYLPGHVAYLRPPRHVDVPFLDIAEQQRRLAAPAVGVAVGVRLSLVVEALLAQTCEHDLDHVGRGAAGQRTETVQEHALFVDRRHDGQAEFATEVEVLLAAARRDVDDARALGAGHQVPGDHTVRGDGLSGGRQLIERAVVGPPDHLGADERAEHLDGTAFLHLVQAGLGDVVDVAVLAHTGVGQLRMHGAGDVGRERPRRRGPDEQVLPLAPPQRQAREDGLVGHVLVALVHLVLADARAAAGAPGHAVAADVDEPPVVALLEEGPDRVVVLVRHRVVGVVPIHPVTEPDGLLRLDGGELADALLALLDEPGDSVLLDVALALEAQLLFHLDLDPEALAVEAVLIALLMAGHGVVAQVDVLVRAAPGVVHLHGVVGRDGAVQEGPAGLALVLAPQLVEDAALVPEPQHLMLDVYQRDLSIHSAKHV